MHNETETPRLPSKPLITPPGAGLRQAILLAALSAGAAWGIIERQWGLAAMIILFGALAASLIWPGGQQFDTAIFGWFNQRGSRPAWLDRAMWLATQLGNRITAGLAALAFGLAGQIGMAAEILLGTLTLWIVVETVKLLTNRTRPYLALEAARVLGKRETGRSFPSGHTAQVFFMAALFSQQLGLGIGAIAALYAAAGLVALTRMYVGVHYPRDVIGGAVLGALWATLATAAGAGNVMLHF